MEEDNRRASLARAGSIYLQDLAFTNQSSTGDTLEAIDRYFDRPYYGLTEDELARFPEALAAAGLDLLRQEGLPTDLGDIIDLEELFNTHCRDQPRRPCQPRPPSPESDKVLADWKEAHSAYWKGLENKPEVLLFDDEKLIAAYRMQAASINLIDALKARHPARIFSESMKLTMLAIRAGVFYLVSKEGRIARSKRLKRNALKRTSSHGGLNSGVARRAKQNLIHEAISACYHGLPLSKQRINPGANVERTLALSGKWNSEWELPSRSTINRVINQLKKNLPTNGKH